jgi:hypothetical protein
VKRSKPLVRRAELRRAPFAPRRTPRPWLRRRGSPNDFPPESRDAIRARSGGRCEARCSTACTGIAAHAHHRQPRELGDQRPVNGLDVCWVCHALIHSSPLRRLVMARGLIVSRYRDPASVPVIAGVIRTPPP